MAKIEMKSWEELMLEEVRAFDVAIADDDVVIFDSDTYDELVVEKDERDLHRWELDPASAEDYREHARIWSAGPAQRWRHFGH